MSGDDLARAASTWRVPATFTPAEGAQIADRALAAVRRYLATIAMRYRGTVPPPPWPASPELARAMTRVRSMRDGFDALNRRGVTRINPARMPAVAGSLKREGDAMFQEALALERRIRALPSAHDVITSARAAGSGGLLLALALAWFLLDAT